VVDLVKLVTNLTCRFIQIGSSEVYGSVDKPVSEDSPINNGSPYSVSKSAFDQHLLLMHKVKGWPVRIIRPSNAYCPGQQLHRIIPKTLISGLSGRKVPLHGGGVARKSYLHATDLSDAILRVIEKGVDGGMYNVGPDNPTSILEVVERCADALKKPLFDLVDIAPERTGQDSCYWLDSSRIKALGWTQKIGWEEGLQDMIQWVGKYPELTALPTEYGMRA
jgi:dTDP-glucose 4,6-dehydratase